LEALVEFVKEVIGEKHMEESSEDLSKSSLSKNLRSSSNNTVGTSECPVLVILDNVHLMDEASWRFLDQIKSEC
jgi:predicted ATPase